MLERGFVNYIELHRKFSESDYPTKLKLFDDHFILSPFKFPVMDPQVSWYTDETRFSVLMDIFLEERRLANTSYERTVEYESHLLTFNVQPLQSNERKHFNNYVQQKFIDLGRIALQRLVKKELKESSSKRIYIQERISVLSNSFEWIPEALIKDINSVKTQFLKIVSNGIDAARFGMEGSSKVRKKYVEHFLYSYGFLMVEHFQWLMKLFSEMENDQFPEPISIERKIVLLNELGIIDLLKNKLLRGSENQETIHIQMSKIISLLTSEITSNYTSVFEYISSLHTATDKDSIKEENIHFIRRELQHLGLSEFAESYFEE